MLQAPTLNTFPLIHLPFDYIQASEKLGCPRDS